MFISKILVIGIIQLAYKEHCCSQILLLLDLIRGQQYLLGATMTAEQHASAFSQIFCHLENVLHLYQ